MRRRSPASATARCSRTDPKAHNAMAKAYVVKGKGVLLWVTFHGGNALAQKDKLIALLKAAAATL